MPKRLTALFLIGLCVGTVGTLFAVRIGWGTFFAWLPESTPGISQKSPQPQGQQPDFWEQISADASLSTVAVQSFSRGTLIRSGSAIVLSSDGLLVSTSDAIPAGASVYQVVFGDRVLRGKVVARDYLKNIALLKIEISGMTVSTLDHFQQYSSGREFVLTGKLIMVNQPQVFTQRAFLNYRSGETDILDTSFSLFLSGAKVVTADGSMAGMASLRNGKVSMISAALIDSFFKQYLQRLNS